ncbi:MAG: phosphoribosylglycinamide formyltransferase [Actinobacteria bacterium]|nr:phosphoribosylglycinamide formyltransferase [Actinomycetota bacterium]
MIRLGLMASGRGSNARAILQAIRDERLDAEVPVLICNRAGAPVLGVAAEYGVTVRLVLRTDFPTRTAQQNAMRDLLLEARVDLAVLAGFSAIFKPSFLAAFPHRVLNIHPSLLPAFAGLNSPEPQAAALRSGVKLAGCTVHLVTQDVDAGPIVAQVAVPVLADDSVERLAERILVQEHRLYPHVLQCFAEGRVRVDGARAFIEERMPTPA